GAAPRDVDAARRAGHAVGVVDEAEIELGLRPQPQPGQRRVVRVVGAIARHGQVDPGQRAAEARGERVGDLHEPGGVAGLREVTVLDVAVAEVIAELDVGRHLAREPEQALEDAALDVVEPHGKDALEHPELEVGVPLDRELVVGTSWTTSRSSASRRASYAGSRAPWCSGTTNALIGASGVGRQIWKRQATGTRPSRLSRANTRYDATAASA